jgi:hypothetical protein
MPVGGGNWDWGSWARQTISPESVTGQRVAFTFGENRKTGTWVLRYVARVVTPGIYRWEPAILQSALAPDQGLAVPQTRVTIEGLGSSAGPGAGPSTAPSPLPDPAPTPTVMPSPTVRPTPTPSPSPAPSMPPTPPPEPSPSPSQT